MHRARHSDASPSTFRPRQAVALVAAAAGLATAIWLPTRFDQAEATDRRGDRGSARAGTEAVTFVDRFAGERGDAPDPEKWAVPAEDARRVRLEGFGTLAVTARGGDTTRMVTREPIELAEGRLEARIQLPEGRGARPSLFLARSADEPGTDLLGAIRRAAPRALGDGFHTVTVEWTPDLAVTSVDGDEVFRVGRDRAGDAWVFDGPFVLGLSLSARDDARRSRFGTRLLVDAVQVSTDAPPATEPPATTPPATTPPATTPPATTPPTTPPTSEPPATTPPPAAADWKPFTLYQAGDRVTFDGVTYEVKESHTSLPAWQPPAVPDLFEPLV